MFNRKTLFVLGAGSSYEFGLPVGSRLAEIIADRLDIRFELGAHQLSGDPEIVEALRIHVRGDINPHRHSAVQISEGVKLTHSIDAFLDIQQGNAPLILCGKLAIAQSIAKAEQESVLYSDPRGEAPTGSKRFDRISTSWLIKFFRIVNSGIPKSDAHQIFENIAIINFNYDRCVEHFLVQAIGSVFVIPDVEGQQIANKLRILHPYGSIGALPWQSARNSVPFGGHPDPRPDALLEMAKQIRTYTERIEEQTELGAIKAEVENAEVIIFLGFAFHRQNMELLKVPDPRKGHPMRIYATAKGMSGADMAAVEAQIRQTVSPSRSPQTLVVHDIGCSALFDECGRSFSMA